MAAVSELHFLCSVCQDVFGLFTEPVTMACGHSFWKVCIARYRDVEVGRHCFLCKYWDGDVPHHCPVCKNACGQKPALGVQTLVSGMTAEHRRPPEGSPPSVSDGSHQDSPGEVPSDVCPKDTALKRKAPDPVVDPTYIKKKARTCENHGEPLEIFCRSDQELICLTCLTTVHKAHDAVMLEDEYERTHTELSKIWSDAKEMMEQRQIRVCELKEFIKKTNEAAAKDKESIITLFGALVSAAQSYRAMAFEEIEKRRRTAEEQARGFMDQLEQDIAALQRTTTELKQSLHSEEHHHLLQTSQSISSIPEVLDLSKVKVQGLEIMRKKLTKCVTPLVERLHHKMDVVPTAKLMRARQFAVNVTLDPCTAMSALVLSEDGKQVRAKRVTSWTDNLFVLSKKGFRGNMFYYEVQVKGNTDWRLGVIEESFKHCRKLQVCWSLQLDKNGNYSSHKPSVTDPLSLGTKPENIGVFVDYNGREVSFYDVDTGALLCCFTRCKFKERLYPMLWCNCDAEDTPLIITPVNTSY